MGQDSSVLTPEQRIEYLDLALRKTKEENNRLRKAVKENGHHARRVERAYDDALLLASLHIAYQPITRERVTQLSRRRWANAIGLLKLARVYNCKAFVAHSLAEIEPALERAKRIALENPTSYRVRLPKHALS